MEKYRLAGGSVGLRVKAPTINAWPPIAAAWIGLELLLPNPTWTVYVVVVLGMFVAEYADARALRKEARKAAASGLTAAQALPSRWRDVGTWLTFLAYAARDVATGKYGTASGRAEFYCMSGIALLFAVRYLFHQVPVVVRRIKAAFGRWLSDALTSALVAKSEVKAASGGHRTGKAQDRAPQGSGRSEPRNSERAKAQK